jgi:hypothetical protein
MANETVGSNCLITPREAGEVLGVGEKQVRRYVQKGWLRPVYSKDKGFHAPLMLHPGEVSALAETLEARPDFTTLVQRSTQAYATARSLERRVERLEQLVGAQYDSTPVDYESMRALYQEARADLEIPPVDSEKIEHWTRIFMGLGEEFFDVLEAYTNDEQAWQTFHDLSRAIIEAAPLEQLGEDEEAKARYRYYERARRNLRAVLFFHIRTRFGSQRATRMFRDEKNLHTRVLGFLSLGQSGRASSRRSGRPSPS